MPLGIGGRPLTFLENLPQNVFCKDLEGRYTFANPPLCALLERSLEALTGLTDFDLHPASLAAKYRKDDEQVVTSGQPMECVEIFQLPSLERIHVQTLKMAMRDETGRVVGIQGLFWDVTARRLKEAELLREREFLGALLDHIPDMIYFKDAESRFVKCSRSVATRLGFASPDEIIGRTDFDLFAREHAVQAVRDEQEVMRTGVPIVAKVECERQKDGREVWVLTTKAPLRNKLGIAIGTFGISKEITELKKIEADLAQARDAALESVRLKTEFLANISHELRTPMNAIIGMTGFLLQTELRPEQRDFAETIRTSASALLEIISDILDFSRIEAGGLTLERSGFDLCEVVETAIDLVAHKARAQGLELVLRLPPGVPRRLNGDPHRIRQVLLNLLSNAIKFTEAGEVVVRVSTLAEDPVRTRLRFEVSDTGIGIPAGAQRRIFESFTQADGSTTRKHGGTGLGLSICKRLVEMMQGTIAFESQPGAGTRFWFDLPLDKDPLKPAAGLADVVPVKRLRCLVVCDHATTRSMLEEHLAALGFQAECVADAAAARHACEQTAARGEHFDLALVEHRLPLIDGFSLVDAFKQDEQTRHLRIVLLTAPGLALKLRKEGHSHIEDFLAKPVKPSRLTDCLCGLVNPASASNTPEPPSEPSPKAATAGTSPLRILLAEDNPLNRKVALRQLKQLGFNADAVENGLEAVRRLEQQVYDLLLLDCQMPFMDGYEVARTVRERERVAASFDGQPVQRLYILAMTANAMEGDREKCLNAGMDDYLSKPAKTSELSAALQRGMEILRRAGQAG